MKKILVLVVMVCLFGCTNDPRNIDGEYLTDNNGNVYQVEANFIDTYFIRDVDEDTIKELEKTIDRIREARGEKK